MSPAILVAIAFSLAIAIVVLHARARRSFPAPETATHAVLKLTDREPSDGSREYAPLADPKVWRSVMVSDLSLAEEVLDWAEAAGYRDLELLVLNDTTFLVRWRD